MRQSVKDCSERSPTPQRWGFSPLSGGRGGWFGDELVEEFADLGEIVDAVGEAGAPDDVGGEGVGEGVTG